MPTDAVVILSTAPPGEAAGIARQLVADRLAACVQLAGIRSFYRWQGRIEDEPEESMLIKTRGSLADAVIARISETPLLRGSRGGRAPGPDGLGRLPGLAHRRDGGDAVKHVSRTGHQYVGGEVREIEDVIVVEQTFRILLNGEAVAAQVASDEQLRELGAGFVIDEGLADEVESVAVEGNVILVTAPRHCGAATETGSSGGVSYRCGVRHVRSDLTMSPDEVRAVTGAIFSDDWQQTGALHCAVLFCGGTRREGLRRRPAQHGRQGGRCGGPRRPRPVPLRARLHGTAAVRDGEEGRERRHPGPRLASGLDRPGDRDRVGSRPHADSASRAGTGLRSTPTRSAWPPRRAERPRSGSGAGRPRSRRTGRAGPDPPYLLARVEPGLAYRHQRHGKEHSGNLSINHPVGEI